MEITRIKDHQEKVEKKQNGQSSNYKMTEHFIPPTHPAYVVTSNFTGPHILALQEQFDKNYIAMSMQTSKKKIAKIPDSPSDKFFIVADDSAGPIILQGQFLTLSKKVVNYPISNNLKQVIEEFNRYVGLGHLEVKEERAQNRYNMEDVREARELEIQRTKIQLQGNQTNQHQIETFNGVDGNALTFNPSLALGGNTATAQSGFSGHSKIVFKEVSSRREDLKVSEGKLFIYDNRKDSEQYKSLVEQLKSNFSESKQIMVIHRIDEYNYYCMNNKETSHIILMSQTTYLTLSNYFTNYHSFAVFGDGNEKMKYHKSQNIVIFTSDRRVMMKFVGEFKQKKEGIQKNKMEKITADLKAFSDKNVEKGKSKRQIQKVEAKRESNKIINKQIVPEKEINQLKQDKKMTSPQIVTRGPTELELVSPKKRVPQLNMPSQSLLMHNIFKIPQEQKINTRSSNTKKIQLKPDAQIYQKQTLLSPKRSKIALVKVTDLDQNALKKLKFAKNNQIPKFKLQNNEIQLKNKVSSLIISQINPGKCKKNLEKNEGSLRDSEGKSQISNLSTNKIKRLKSCRKFKENKGQNDKKVQEAYQLPTFQSASSKPKLRPSVKTHLRTGSDHQNYMKLEKMQEPKRSFEEGENFNQGKFTIPSIIAPENDKESQQNYVRYPKDKSPSDSKKRCSISNKSLDQNQEVKMQPTIVKLLESSNRSDDNNNLFRTSISPSISPESRSKKQIISQISSKGFPPENKELAEESESDDNVLMVKRPELKAAELASHQKTENKIEEEKEQEDNDLVFVIKTPLRNGNELQKNRMGLNVKSAEDRFDSDLLMIKKPTASFSDDKKVKKILKIQGSIPPVTKTIENSVEESMDYKYTPNFNRQKPNNAQNGNCEEENSIRLQKNQNEVQVHLSSNFFGDSQPSSIKNSNPLIVVNSPKKMLEDPPRISFGAIAADPYSLQQRQKPKSRDSQTLLVPSENKVKYNIVETSSLIQPQSNKKEGGVPLKSRKVTDKDKNQNVLKKIFKKSDEKSNEKQRLGSIEKQKGKDNISVHENQNPIVTNRNDVKEEDPYGLPLLKSLKKKNVMQADSKEFKDQAKTKRNEEKIGKIYSTLKARSTQGYQFPHSTLKDSGNLYSEPSRIGRINSAYLPHGSLGSMSHYPYKKPLETPFPHSKSNEPRQVPLYLKREQAYSQRPSSVRAMRVRSIEDYIDLDKYDKVIQNGVTIYRAKEPLPSIVFSPKSLKNSSYFLPTDSRPEFVSNNYKKQSLPCNNSDQVTYHSQLNSNSIAFPPNYIGHSSPYSHLLSSPHHFGQNGNNFHPSQSDPSKKSYDDLNAEVKALTYQICKNILSKPNQLNVAEQKQPFSERSPNKPELTSPSLAKNQSKPPLPSKIQNLNPKQAQSLTKSQAKKKISQIPLQNEAQTKQKLKKALSVSSINKLQMRLPKIPSKNMQSFTQQLQSSYSQQKSIDNKYESMVLYLIDKNKEIDYSQLQLLKKDKDSLIYYKDQKQLAQQIIKSQSVYDLVYILAPSLTAHMRKILKHYDNCFLVDFGSEVRQIRNNHVYVPSVEELEEITVQLVGEMLEKRKNMLTVPSSPQPQYYKRPVHKRVQKSELYQGPKGCEHHCCPRTPVHHQCKHQKCCQECGQILI